MRDLAAGSHFAGHSIDAVIGRGGMGLVYRATDLALDRVVALKIVAPELAGDDAFRNRFKRESKVAASIRHPHVIPVYHAGEEDGRLYITMQYVEGIDLKEMIARDGRVPVPLAAELVIQISDGLDAAHARGLVHRDV
jgi:serine/threonine protein kinase